MAASAAIVSAARAFSEGLQMTGRAVKDALSAARSASLDCEPPAGDAMPGRLDTTRYAGCKLEADAKTAHGGSPLMRRSLEDSASLLSDSKVVKAAITASALQFSVHSMTLPPYIEQTHCLAHRGDAGVPPLTSLPPRLPTSPRGTGAAPAAFSLDQLQPAFARPRNPHPASSLSDPTWTHSSRGEWAKTGPEVAAACGCSHLRRGVLADGDDSPSALGDGSVAASDNGQLVRAGPVVDSIGRMSGLQRLRIDASRHPQVIPEQVYIRVSRFIGTLRAQLPAIILASWHKCMLTLLRARLNAMPTALAGASAR